MTSPAAFAGWLDDTNDIHNGAPWRNLQTGDRLEIERSALDLDAVIKLVSGWLNHRIRLQMDLELVTRLIEIAALVP